MEGVGEIIQYSKDRLHTLHGIRDLGSDISLLGELEREGEKLRGRERSRELSLQMERE